MSGEKQRVDAYMDTIRRMEPDIAMVDRDAALASIAISLKRIADALSVEGDNSVALSLRHLADAVDTGGIAEQDERNALELILGALARR